MKRILFTAMIANALIIFNLTSCKKESFSPAPYTSPVVQTYTGTINLVANNWIRDADGIYSNTFGGVISPANTNNHRIKIYLVENGTDTEITYPRSYMGGELWASHTQTSVKIIYRTGDKDLPFSYLVIKVVIE